MDRILCISIEPCKHHKFFPGLLTHSRWHPLCSLYLSSNLWGLLFPKKWECTNILHIFPIFMPIYEHTLTEYAKKWFAFILSSHWIRKKEDFILLCLFNSEVVFPVTKAFWNLRVITAWCLLNPLLARPEPSGCLSWLTFEEHYEVCVMTHLCLWNI